ncbi:MAG TPA: hypothetical protein VKA46_36140, partial [Gemmataceae bacterium]|nr:hypothetical protein [Gemmataceae bacterium]
PSPPDRQSAGVSDRPVAPMTLGPRPSSARQPGRLGAAGKIRKNNGVAGATTVEEDRPVCIRGPAKAAEDSCQIGKKER